MKLALSATSALSTQGECTLRDLIRKLLPVNLISKIV